MKIAHEIPKILFIVPIPPPYGGVEHSMKELLNSELSKSYNLVHIRSNFQISNTTRGSFSLGKLVRLLKICLDIVIKTLTEKTRIAYYPLSSNRSGTLRDVIILLLLKILGYKIVAHYMGGHFRKFYHFSSKVFRIIIKIELRIIDVLLVLGQRILEDFKDIYPGEKQIEIVQNGLSIRIQKIEIKRSTTPDNCRIFFIGMLSFYKGFFDLITVYKSLIKQFPEISLAFAGEISTIGGEKNILKSYLTPEQQFRTKNSDTSICSFINESEEYNANYLGIISGERKERAFLDSDIFVLPSYSEGLSMAVLEAMDYGLPVIIGDVGAMNEVVEENANGYLVKPGDVNNLQGRLKYLIENPKLRRNMGKRSKEIIKERFQVSIIAKRLVRVFSEVKRNNNPYQSSD